MNQTPVLAQKNQMLLKNQSEAVSYYKKARKLVIWSCVCTGIGTVCFIMSSLRRHDDISIYDIIGGGSLIAGGVLAGISINKMNKAQKILSSAPIISYDYKIGDYILSPSVDLITESQTHKHHLGIGLNVCF